MTVLVAAAAIAACGTSEHRDNFGIVGYHFEGNSIVVDSQRPEDPGCYVDPRLEVTKANDGLHVRVTYRRTSQKFCIVPCPIGPLTQRQTLPPGSSGLRVVLDAPAVNACIPVTGGPATVP